MTSSAELKILHIEDDHYDAVLVEEMLKQSCGNLLNFNRVSNLKSAISELSKHEYNIILLDLILGDVSGVRCVEAIRSQCPNTAIVVLTGIEGDDAAVTALRAGAQEYLVKAYQNGQALKYVMRSAIERKTFENELYQKANFDSLTNLPNFRFLNEYLEIDICKASRWKKQIAVMFLDIYKFKQVNDNLGHESGNLVIQEVGRRIKSKLRSSDFFARYGGDEFVAVLDMQDSCVKAGCAQVANKIFNELKKPINVENNDLMVSVNIGFSFFPDNGKTAKDLLDSADKAMFKAKQSGANIYKFASH